MAATFSSANPLSYAELFGCDKSLIQQAAACGVEIKAQVGSLTVVGKDGNVYGTSVVKGSALTLAKNGNLGPASKHVIQVQLEKAMIAAIKASGGSVSDVPTPKVDTTGMSPGQKAAVTKALKGVNLSGAAPVAKPVLKPHQPTVSGVDGYPSVADATKMYQHVKGTSSLYRVIALYPGLNVALRRTKSQLSLRAEGPALPASKVTLGSIGFNDNGGYMSVHFDVQDAVLVRKTVGAMVGLLGFAKAHAIGDPLEIPMEA